MKECASSIGFIGVPDEKVIAMLEEKLGKRIKKIEKDNEVVLLIGRGLFKKKIVITK